MEMPSGPYLVLISSASIVGQLLKCNIYRVE
jgi:phosphatidylinositol 4-phosphatase